MVLVAVGEDEPDDVLSLLDEKADIRQDQIDAGQLLLGREGDAAIDDQPLPAALVAKTVDREVHPDFADAAERRKHQFALGHQSTRPVAAERAVCSPIGKTSPAVIVCTVPSATRKSRPPPSSSPSQRPKNSRPGSRTCISPPMPAARSSQSARMAAKPAPRRHCASRRSIVADNAPMRSAADTWAPAAARSV